MNYQTSEPATKTVSSISLVILDIDKHIDRLFATYEELQEKLVLVCCDPKNDADMLPPAAPPAHKCGLEKVLSGQTYRLEVLNEKLRRLINQIEL